MTLADVAWPCPPIMLAASVSRLPFVSCLPIRELSALPPCHLQEYTNKLAAVQGKGDDYEVAAAQIGVEVYSAMNAAIGG